MNKRIALFKVSTCYAHAQTINESTAQELHCTYIYSMVINCRQAYDFSFTIIIKTNKRQSGKARLKLKAHLFKCYGTPTNSLRLVIVSFVHYL